MPPYQNRALARYLGMTLDRRPATFPAEARIGAAQRERQRTPPPNAFRCKARTRAAAGIERRVSLRYGVGQVRVTVVDTLAPTMIAPGAEQSSAWRTLELLPVTV